VNALEHDDYALIDIMDIQKSYAYFFKCYMKSKGFTVSDGSYFKKDNPREQVVFDNFAAMGIKYMDYKEGNHIQEILLHRYALYPIMFECTITSLWIPNPVWGYGFLEKMISTLDDFLLDDVFNKQGVYNEIVLENAEFIEFIRSKKDVVFTNAMIQEEKQRMLKLEFTPKYLSFDLYKRKDNPYKKCQKAKH
jgi:hypothetical protein